MIFSFNKEKLCFHFITIFYEELYILFILGIWIINVSFTYEFYAWVLLDCQLFLKFLASPEDITLISKCCGYILVAVTMEIVEKSCQ